MLVRSVIWWLLNNSHELCLLCKLLSVATNSDSCELHWYWRSQLLLWHDQDWFTPQNSGISTFHFPFDCRNENESVVDADNYSSKEEFAEAKLSLNPFFAFKILVGWSAHKCDLQHLKTKRLRSFVEDLSIYCTNLGRGLMGAFDFCSGDGERVDWGLWRR